jgi:hypothetical protein
MSAPMEFKIGGETISKNNALPPVVVKLKKFLDNAEDGSLWTNRNISKEIGMCESGISGRGMPDHLPEYTTKGKIQRVEGMGVRDVRIWGNPTTIKAYNDQK